MDNIENLEKWKIPQLNSFLRDRSITYSGKRKADLVKLVEACIQLGLPTDAELESEVDDVGWKNKLEEMGVPNPCDMDAKLFTTDLSACPTFGLFDIFNYLLKHRADYDRKKLQAYKSATDYRLFVDGHVEHLEYSENGGHALGIFRAEVKPTQKEKTHLKKKTYSLWMLLRKEHGTVELALCECPGGADGACRHLAAALYEIEAYMEKVKTCTDVPMPWVKKARQTDDPVEISQLVIKKAKYTTVVDPEKVDEDVDLRHPDDRHPPTEADLRNFADGLMQIDVDSCCLQALCDPDQLAASSAPKPASPPPPPPADSRYLAIRSRLHHFVTSLPPAEYNTEDLYELFVKQNNYTDDERESIALLTVGQSDNVLWRELRQDRMTASNGQRIFTRSNTLLVDPSADTSSLLTLLTEHKDLSHLPNISWGIDREAKAIQDYLSVEKVHHESLTVRKHGLQVLSSNPFIACSPDGVVCCKCKYHKSGNGKTWLIEVKCPSTFRDESPQKAAIATCGVQLDLDNKEWVLRENHKYYYQIQMQLGIMGLAHCELVVHTKQGHIKVHVKYNEAKFQDIISKLSWFGKSYLFPHVISHTFT